MSETLLRTKLHIPPLRPNVVSRPRLVERLNEGIRQGCKLILISAPAGFVFDVNLNYPYLSGSLFMFVGFLVSLLWVTQEPRKNIISSEGVDFNAARVDVQ